MGGLAHVLVQRTRVRDTRQVLLQCPDVRFNLIQDIQLSGYEYMRDV